MSALESFRTFLHTHPDAQRRFDELAAAGGDDVLAKLAAVAQEAGFSLTEEDLERLAVQLETSALRSPRARRRAYAPVPPPPGKAGAVDPIAIGAWIVDWLRGRFGK